MIWKQRIKEKLFWAMACLICLSLLGAVGCSDSDNNAPPPATGYVQASLGGTQDDYFTRHGSRSIAKTADGGFILVGDSDSKDGDLTANKGLFDLWVIRLSSDLKILWQKALGGTQMDGGSSVTEARDGGFVIAGYTESNDGDVTGGYHGGGDVWVIRLDASGKVLWNRCFGGSRLDAPSAIIQAGDEGLFVAGYSNSNDGDAAGNTGAFNAWIFKIDKDGHLVWQRSVGGSNKDQFNAVTVTSDGGLVAIGRTLSTEWEPQPPTPGIKLFAVRLDSAGQVQWLKTISTNANEEGTAIHQAANGDFFTCGWSSIPGASKDMLLARLNASGEEVWSRTFGGSGSDSAFDLALYNDQIYLVGESYSNDGDFPGSKGQSDMVAARVDANGVLKGYVRLGGKERESAGAIVLMDPAKEPAFLIPGWTASRDGDVKANHGGRDIWLVKVRSDLGK